MKIVLDTVKYKKRMLSLWILTIVFGSVAILILVMNLVIHKRVNVESIFMITCLGALFAFFAYLTNFYFSLRKLEYLMTYELGVLDDFSKPFNKGLALKKEDIESIESWSGIKGINQYKLVRKGRGSHGNGVMNQLKGDHIYVTDYLVNSDELDQLMRLMSRELG